MLNEPILENDYPVHSGYLYVVDGDGFYSPISGTVLDLKQYARSVGLDASIVRRYDIVGRQDVKYPPPRWLDLILPPDPPEPAVKKRMCWMIVLHFGDDVCRQEVHTDSHKKAIKLFETSVEAWKNGKQPELSSEYVRRAASEPYKIKRVYSV